MELLFLEELLASRAHVNHMLPQVARLTWLIALPVVGVELAAAASPVEIEVIRVSLATLQIGPWWHPKALNCVSDDNLVVLAWHHRHWRDVLDLELFTHAFDRV